MASASLTGTSCPQPNSSQHSVASGSPTSWLRAELETTTHFDPPGTLRRSGRLDGHGEHSVRITAREFVRLSDHRRLCRATFLSHRASDSARADGRSGGTDRATTTVALVREWPSRSAGAGARYSA